MEAWSCRRLPKLLAERRTLRRGLSMGFVASALRRRIPMLGTSEDTTYRNAFRMKRLATFLALADDVLRRKSECTVLDVGGGRSYWAGLEEVWAGRNLRITLVNVDERAETDGLFTYVKGDARDMRQFPDQAFDLVHSNSVIEHVGRWSDMRRMADEVRRLAPIYFVQTPNFWFPIEPHMRTPFIHWLPAPWRRGMVMRKARGFYAKADSFDAAHAVLDDASLIDAAAMGVLFPDARIVRERVGPFTKSLIAIKGPVSPETVHHQ